MRSSAALVSLAWARRRAREPGEQTRVAVGTCHVQCAVAAACVYGCEEDVVGGSMGSFRAGFDRGLEFAKFSDP